MSSTGTQYTFPVNVAGKVKYLSFNGNLNDLTTDSKALQDAIEECRRFKSGEIVLLNGQPNKVDTSEEKPDTLPKKEYPEVTDIQGAVHILKTEYNIAHQSLRSPEGVLKKAEEVGITFPNL